MCLPNLSIQLICWHCCVQIDMMPPYQAASYTLPSYSNPGRKPDAYRTQARSKRKSALQKQLEGNVRRTIYICDIDQQVRF